MTEMKAEKENKSLCSRSKDKAKKREQCLGVHSEAGEGVTRALRALAPVGEGGWCRVSAAHRRAEGL